MHKYLRFFTALTVVAVLLGGLIAPAHADKIKLVFWTEDTAVPEPVRPQFTQLFVDSFNAAHPDVELSVEFTATEWDTTRTAIQGGAGPDLVLSPGPAFANLLGNANSIVPLNDYAKQYGWQDKLQPWTYSASLANGTLWSVPVTFETMLFYYNKTQFDKNKWAAPQTLADVEKVCDTWTKADKNNWCFSHSNAFWKGVNEWLISSVFNNYAGADKVQEALSGKRQWTDPLFVQSVDVVNSWQQKGWFSGGIDNYFALNYDDHMANFCSGKAIMNMEGTWGFQNMQNYCKGKDDWEWTITPSLRSGVTSVFPLAIGTSLSINAKSAHPKEAAMVLDWMYNDKGRAAKIASLLGFSEWVVPLKWTSKDFPDADARVLRYFDAINDAVNKGNIGYTTWSFWPAKTDASLIEDLDLVFTGKMTSADYLKKQQGIFDGELKAGQVPLAPPTNIKTT